MSNALGLGHRSRVRLEKFFIDFETVFTFHFVVDYVIPQTSEFFSDLNLVSFKRITESADFLNNVLNMTYAIDMNYQHKHDSQ